MDNRRIAEWYAEAAKDQDLRAMPYMRSSVITGSTPKSRGNYNKQRSSVTRSR